MWDLPAPASPAPVPSSPDRLWSWARRRPRSPGREIRSTPTGSDASRRKWCRQWSRCADHRKQLQRDHALSQRSLQFFGRNRLAFHVLVQQVVIVLDDGLDHLIMESIGLLLQLFGNFLGHVFGAQSLIFPDNRLHLE